MIPPDGGSSDPLSGHQVGSYRILERIGRGGMGEVFRGWDDKLGRPVAVKALPQALAADSVARRRFVRETRVACRVVHPYVATVFDVVEQETRLFLVMEYIEGKSFDDFLHDERTGPRDVTRYGLEIAEALAAIHKAGLVHRDLKPANVMVTPAGHVKVMDFGVAFPLSRPEFLPDGSTEPTEQRLTGEGLGVGTISYMAPEQIRGQAVDPRSDLFSLGIVLYEAITGEHPFMRESLLATASAILNEPPGTGPEPESLTNSGPLRQVVLRLLEKDPARRYQNSDAVVADLKAVAHGDPLAVRRVEERAGPRAAWALVAVAGIAAAGYGIYRQRHPTPPRFEARPVVAVLPFEDRRGLSPDDGRASMLSDLIAAGIGESKRMRSLGSARVEEILAGSGTGGRGGAAIAAVSVAAPVRWLLAGTLYEEGGQYQATVELHASGKPEPLETFKVAARGVAPLADLVLAHLASSLFPDARPESGGAAGGTAPPRPTDEVAVLETRARKALGEYRIQEALELLRKAVAIDDKYLPVETLLAVALDRAGYGRDALAAATRAEQLARPPDAGWSPRLVLEARTESARLHHDAKAELDFLRARASRYPDDPETLVALTDALLRGSKFDEAATVIDRVIELDPKDPRAHLVRARVQTASGRLDDAAASVARASSIFRDLRSQGGMAEAEVAEGNLAFRRSAYADAGRLYASAVGHFRDAGLGARAATAEKLVADAELHQGNFESADMRYRSAVTAARSVGDYRTVVETLGAQGGGLYLFGRMEQAEKALRQALAEAIPLQNPMLGLVAKVNLAGLLSYTGRLGEARGLAEESLATAREGRHDAAAALALSLLADIDYQQGRLEDGLRAYRDIIALYQATPGTEGKVSTAHLGVAEILEAQGKLSAALDEVAAAARIEEVLRRETGLPYVLVMRGRLESALGEWQKAGSDLQEVDRLASRPGNTLEDIKPRLVLARAYVEMARGDFGQARELAERAGTLAAQAEGVAVEVPALTLLGLASARLGHLAESVAACTKAVDHPKALASERTFARAALAEARFASGDLEGAEREARRALDEAEQMGVALAGARAASVVVSLPRAVPDNEIVARRGRTLLERYIGSAPVDRRDAVRARADLSQLIQALHPANPRS